MVAVAAALALVAGVVTAATAHADPVEHVQNGTFDTGTAPWWWTSNAPAEVVGGELCAPIPAGTANPWDAILGHNDIPLTDGVAYTLSFDASADRPATIRANVQLGVEPWTTALSQDIQIGERQTYTYTFTSNTTSPGGQVAFQVGATPRRSRSAWTTSPSPATAWSARRPVGPSASSTAASKRGPPGGSSTAPPRPGSPTVGSAPTCRAGWPTRGTPASGRTTSR